MLNRLILLFLLIPSLACAVTWPIRIDVSGKYLEDQNDIPFLLIADAGWELTTQITDAQVITYLESRMAKGFNAVEIRIIGSYFQDNAPADYYSNAPFTNGVNDWSVKNETYWARMDAILTEMKARDMIALVFPAYLGYECGTQGWCGSMVAQTNDAMNTYGQWLGTRYGEYGNIIWMTGGDVDCSDYTNACDRNNAVVTGIRTTDTDAIVSAEPASEQIGGIDSYLSVVDINAVYTYVAPQSLVESAYNGAQPFLYQEGHYENEHSTIVRVQQSQAMIGFLGGAKIGHIFGTCPLWSFGGDLSYCDSSSAPFDSWQNNLSSPGSISMGYIGRLMRSRNWSNFVPDYDNSVVTSSKGTEGNYRATARESTGQTVMVWCPDTTAVTVDMTKISGTQAKAWWYDPDDNTAALIGTYDTTGTRDFTPGSARLVLILDDNSASLNPPGILNEPLKMRNITFSGGGTFR